MLNALSDTAYSNQASSRKTDVSVAVLPFKNISSDSLYDHICQGFVLELITDFSRFKCFRIVSYHSTSLLNPDAAIGSEDIRNLEADYIVRGTFGHHRDEINIYVQLISTCDNRLVWADKYQGNVDHVFSLQENALEQLVVALQQQLNFDILSDYKKKPLANLNAYACWLLGFNELKKGSLEADEKARTFFQEAISIDPQYSKAYTGMSLSFFNEWSCQIWERWDVSQKGAFKYAMKAFELDEYDYTSALVLGRVYLYDGAYDTAEHFVRKSIRLNPNDTDNLIQAASCLTLLGYAGDALKLYYKAMHLNPAGNESYRSFGIFIHFENGEFEKALQIAQLDIGKYGWVDMPGYIAATYYMLGKEDKMNEYWNIFVEEYKKKIAKEKEGNSAEALAWMIRVNPHKGKSNIAIFWDFMRTRLNISQTAGTHIKKSKIPAFQFREEGGLWYVAYEGVESVIQGAKGLADIRKLLSAPGRAIHCSELMGASIPDTDNYLVFDDKAKKAYQEKILSLQKAIKAAEAKGFSSKLEALQEEYDQLLDYLSRSTGIGGKTRKANHTIDKVRSAVTWRIRNSIDKIEKTHPALARHLSVSIKTGIFCTYSPEKPADWNL